MTFGQPATDADNSFLWDTAGYTPAGWDATAPLDYNLLYQGNNIDTRLITATNPTGTSEGNFYYKSKNVFNVTLMAKPKPTNRKPYPTFRDSNLVMTNSLKLDRMVGADGIAKREALYFDVTSSVLTYTSLGYIPDPDEDPETKQPFAIQMLNSSDILETVYTSTAGKVQVKNLGYSNYPIRVGGTTLSGEDRNDLKTEHTSLLTDQNLIAKNKFLAYGYIDPKYSDRAGDERYVAVPYVERFEEHYKYNGTGADGAWNHTLATAQTQNVFFVFTLPKEFSKANN